MKQMSPETQLADRLQAALVGVDGFLYLGEAWALLEAVRVVPVPQDDLTVVEIGSWKGRSTIALGMGVQARGNGRVYAIDPHTGSRELIEMYGRVDTYAEFMANVERAGLASFVEPIRTTSHAARARFRDNSVHVLFVDGSHEYYDVLRDIDDWVGALSNGAVLAFNDPSSPGVYRALRKRVLRIGSPLRRPHLVQNTLFFELRQGSAWRLEDGLALWRLRFVLLLRRGASIFWPYMPKWMVRMGHRVSAVMLGRHNFTPNPFAGA